MKQKLFKTLGLKAVLPVFLLILCSCTDRNQMNFYKVCANNDVETCKAILEKHPDIPMNVLQMTSLDPTIQSWLEENKPQYYPSDASASQKLNNLGNLKTVTRITVICDSVDVLSFLLESWKIDNTDLNDGLSLAVQNGRRKIAELLLKNGANPNGIIEDEVSYGVAYDESYLNYSIKKKNEDIAKILIEYGADVNYEDKLHKENDPFLTSSINGSTTYGEKTNAVTYCRRMGRKRNLRTSARTRCKFECRDDIRNDTFNVRGEFRIYRYYENPVAKRGRSKHKRQFRANGAGKCRHI